MVAEHEIVNKSQLARRLGVDRRTIADLIRIHQIRTIAMGSSDCLDRDAYLRLLPHLSPTSASA
jgi:excisionase family DNA binding protein